MGLFDRIMAGWSPEERAVYEAAREDFRMHNKQRPCPERCGCTEFYDDRNPEVPDGGFGIAGCPCTRCNPEHDSAAEGGESP